MRNLLLIIALVTFTFSSYANKTIVKTTTNIEFCEDGKKCDKKDCKHKADKTACSKDCKKACCSKEATTKKSCCASKTGTKCSKSASATKATDVKKEVKETK